LTDSSEAILLTRIVKEIREYRGFTRKSFIAELARIFDVDCKFDDAGWFEAGREKIVVTTDGIAEEFVKEDPWSAGYYSVVVNVNDVVAKGAKPVGYVSVISSNSQENLRKMVEGIKSAIDKYGLKVLKFHTQPDSTYNSVDAAVVGVAKNIIPSSSASPNDKLLLAVDMDGYFGSRGWVRFFDSTRDKSSNDVWKLIDGMITISEKRLANASRDISTPGFIGSIAMLCESSCVGARIQLNRIPKPKDVDLLLWLTSYPSSSFIVSTTKSNECRKILQNHGYKTEIVGEITKDKKIVLIYKGKNKVFLDLEKESIFGMKREPNTPKKYKTFIKKFS